MLDTYSMKKKASKKVQVGGELVTCFFACAETHIPTALLSKHPWPVSLPVFCNNNRQFWMEWKVLYMHMQKLCDPKKHLRKYTEDYRKMNMHTHLLFQGCSTKSTISSRTEWRYRSNDNLVSGLQVVASSKQCYFLLDIQMRNSIRRLSILHHLIEPCSGKRNKS